MGVRWLVGRMVGSVWRGRIGVRRGSTSLGVSNGVRINVFLACFTKDVTKKIKVYKQKPTS